MRQEKTFRLGTTSYIYPDRILPNVHRLKGRVDDIELLLFEVNDLKSALSGKEMRELAAIARDWALTYTVHLPLGLELGAADERKRDDEIARAAALIDHLGPLNPFAYVLHLNLSATARRKVRSWRERITGSLQALLSRVSCAPGRIAVENLEYPFSIVADIVAQSGLSRCIDIGHLLKTKEPLREHLRKYLPRTRVVHWHGLDKSRRRDHASLEHQSPEEIRMILKLLKTSGYKGVVTLEVFSERDLETSLDILERYR